MAGKPKMRTEVRMTTESKEASPIRMQLVEDDLEKWGSFNHQVYINLVYT